jgi:poly(3-hydroxybutyrate) depolymerase
MLMKLLLSILLVAVRKFVYSSKWFVSAMVVLSLSYGQRQTENSYRSQFGPNALVGFLSYVPPEYNSNPTKSFPILIFLHGMGEKVWNPKDLSQLYRVKTHGPPKLIDQGQDFPFIVISPQCPFPSWDELTVDNFQTSVLKPGEFVDEIIEKMKTLYRVDAARIYITGLSMGGAGVWSYTLKHPEKIAASIPIAGWVSNGDVCAIAQNNVAIWTFQGQYDSGNTIQGVVNNINACRPVINPPAKATIYAGVGHDAWTRTYNNTGAGIAPDNIYSWLMRQARSSVISNSLPLADAGEDQPLVLPNNSARLIGSAQDYDGTIVSYTWTQTSGITVALTGASTNTLSLSNLIEGSYGFKLTVKDDKGGLGSDEVWVNVSVPEGSGGLQAEYYLGVDLKGTAVKRTETNIAYDWGDAAPMDQMPADRYSVRWTGKVTPLYSETYTFYTLSDDGVRLWVNGIPIVNNWTYHGATENSGAIMLEAGKAYDIKMEYFESGGSAIAKLSWSSLTQTKEIIPAVAFMNQNTSTARNAAIDEATGIPTLSVYPQPADGLAYLQYKIKGASSVSVQLVDAMASVYMEDRFEANSPIMSYVIDLHDVPSGLYYLVVSQGDTPERVKLLVAK